MHSAILRAVGGSVMVAIPKPILQALGWSSCARVGLTISRGKLVVEKPRYTLDQLLAQCDPKAPLSAEDVAWDRAPPVGREVF
jgi:antitoxin ChpS